MSRSEPKKGIFRARFRVTWPYRAGGYPDQQKALEVYYEYQSDLRTKLTEKVSEILGNDLTPHLEQRPPEMASNKRVLRSGPPSPIAIPPLMIWSLSGIRSRGAGGFGLRTPALL